MGDTAINPSYPFSGKGGALSGISGNNWGLDNIETLPILCSSNREAPPQRTITDMQWGFLTTLSQF